MIALDRDMRWVVARGLQVLCVDEDTAEALLFRLRADGYPEAREARPCRGWAAYGPSGWCGEPVILNGTYCGNCHAADSADRALALPYTEHNPEPDWL